MKDYTDIGLTPRLNSATSIVEKRKETFLAASFGARSEANLITPSRIQGKSFFPFESVTYDTQQTTTSTSYTDVTGSSMDINLKRDSYVLIIVTCNTSVLWGAAEDDSQIQQFIRVFLTNVDYPGGAVLGQAVCHQSEKFSSAEGEESWMQQTVGTHRIVEFPKGKTNIKLQFKKTQATGSGGTCELNYYVFSYLVLGA